jgi:nitrile hydratase subunit beta
MGTPPDDTRPIVDILSASLRDIDGIHDMGGMAGFGPVDVSAGASGHEGWEARLQATALLSGGMSRPGIEAIPPAEYLTSEYAEKWLVCSEQRLLGDGVVDRGRLDHWCSELSTDPTRRPTRDDDPEAVPGLVAMLTTTPLMSEVTAPRFAVGDRVRVRRMRPEGHHRCPRYVRGAIGVVDRVPGGEHQPPAEPGGDVGKFEAVYTIQFDSPELWGDQRSEGEPTFDLFIDLWESYLEAP